MRTVLYLATLSAARELTPKISRGFAQGLKVLQEMVPTEDMSGPKVTLECFLHDALRLKKDSVRILTGGHSQGGALSPLVALWLRDTQARAHRWL